MENVQVHTDDIISRDTYNETKLLTNFKKYDNDQQILILKCAIQISVIGSGNKTFGFIKINDKIIEITTIFDKLNIVYGKRENEKYNDDLITARRIVRLLRFHIQQFVIQNNRPSYLWTKYSMQDKSMIPYCFPGAEHLIENKEHGIYLYNTYKKLDDKLGTKFCDRLKRTYLARNLFTPLELQNLK